MTWQQDEFVRSLSSSSDNTVLAYVGDVAQFVTWAERAGLEGPAAVDRLFLRRYLAYLATRRFARRSIARKAAALRRYFGWLVRTGAIPVDPSARLTAPRGESRLPHVLRPAELEPLLEAGSTATPSPCGTSPCSSCSTAAGCGSASCAA